MFTQSHLRQYLLTLVVGASGWLFGFVIYNTAIAAVNSYLDRHGTYDNSSFSLVKLQGVRTSNSQVWFTQMVFPHSNTRIPLNLFEQSNDSGQITQTLYGNENSSIPRQYWSDFGNLSRGQLGNFNFGEELLLQSSNGNLSRYQVIDMAFGEQRLKELTESANFHGLIIKTVLPGELSGMNKKIIFGIYLEPVVSFYT